MVTPNSQECVFPRQVLAVSRIMVAWQPVGMAMGVYDMTLRYTKERSQFGTPLAGFQLTQEKLARMLGNIQVLNLRSLCSSMGPFFALPLGFIFLACKTLTQGQSGQEYKAALDGASRYIFHHILRSWGHFTTTTISLLSSLPIALRPLLQSFGSLEDAYVHQKNYEGVGGGGDFVRHLSSKRKDNTQVEGKERARACTKIHLGAERESQPVIWLWIFRIIFGSTHLGASGCLVGLYFMPAYPWTSSQNIIFWVETRSKWRVLECPDLPLSCAKPE